VHWQPSGKSLPLAELHLEAGETRELRTPVPPLHIYRGSIVNWERIEARQRPRMLRIGDIRAHIDWPDGTFELLLADPLPFPVEVELGRYLLGMTLDNSRPGNLVARDDARGTLELEDTIAGQPHLCVRCEPQHEGTIRIDVFRLTAAGSPWIVGSIPAGGRILLPADGKQLLLVVHERLAQQHWVLAMQTAPCEAGDMSLEPVPHPVTVLGDRQGWSIVALAPAPFQDVPASLEIDSSGSLLVPAGAAGLHAQRGDAVRDLPAGVDMIELR
jgi:hypothetical protein